MRDQMSSSRVMRRVLMSCVAVMCVMTSVSTATAQDGQSLDEETTKQMLSYIREANTFYKAEDWEKALELYKQAYALSPNPKLLYRMGKSAENAGKLREAIGFYEQFMTELPDEDASKKVAGFLPELKAKIPPTVTITSTPPNANVYVGSLTSAPVGSTPYSGEMGLGEVTVLVKLDGYQVYSQSFDFEGAEEVDIQASLIREVADGDDSSDRSGPVEPGSGAKFKKIGWVSTGVGVALLGAGGVMSARQMSAEDQVNNYDKAGSSDPTAGRQEISELKDRANNSWRNAMIFYSAGGLLTVAGVGMVTLGMMRDADSEKALRFEFAPTVGGAQVGVSKSF